LTFYSSLCFLNYCLLHEYSLFAIFLIFFSFDILRYYGMLVSFVCQILSFPFGLPVSTFWLSNQIVFLFHFLNSGTRKGRIWSTLFSITFLCSCFVCLCFPIAYFLSCCHSFLYMYSKTFGFFSSLYFFFLFNGFNKNTFHADISSHTSWKVWAKCFFSFVFT